MADMKIQDLWPLIYLGLTVVGFFLLLRKYAHLRPFVEALGPKTTAQRLQDSEIRLMDVRSPREWETGVVEGSILMSHDQLELPDTSLPIVCVCNSGIRAHQAAEDLKRLGLKEVYYLNAGLRDLQNEQELLASETST